jgi:mRNA-degrading endonuclease toxin of MazEF toxin-antitoxin module
MKPIFLERGSIYYCENLKLLSGKSEITIRNKYILILQGGGYFKNSNKVNILLGTKEKTDFDNIYPHDILIKASHNGFPLDTKFNCAEIYIMHKVDVLKSEYKFKLDDNDMNEIGKKIILGLQIV